MIDYQRRAPQPWSIASCAPTRSHDDRLLEAFLAVPRERFVPEHLRGIAYIDEDIPLGGGRYLIEPMVLGRLLQLAAIAPGERRARYRRGNGLCDGASWRASPRASSRSRPRSASWPRRGRVSANSNAPMSPSFKDRSRPAIPPARPMRDPHQRRRRRRARRDRAAAAPGGRLVTVLKRGAGMGQAVLATEVGGILSHRPVFDAAHADAAGFPGGAGLRILRRGSGRSESPRGFVMRACFLLPWVSASPSSSPARAPAQRRSSRPWARPMTTIRSSCRSAQPCARPMKACRRRWRDGGPPCWSTGAVGREQYENTPGVLGSPAPPNMMITPETIDLNITQPVYQGGQTVAKTAAAEAMVQGRARPHRRRPKRRCSSLSCRAITTFCATRRWSSSTSTTSKCCAASSRRPTISSASAR